MPGGTPEAYQHIEPIVKAVAAQVRIELLLTYHKGCLPALWDRVSFLSHLNSGVSF